MGYGHSLDLRRRVIEAVAMGASAREAGRRFAISASAAIKLVRRWRETGSYAPGQIGGQKKRRLAARASWLHEVMAHEPDVTLAELQRRLAEGGIRVSLETINATLKALGYSFKKKACGPRSKSAPTSPGGARNGRSGRAGSIPRVWCSLTRPAPRPT